MRSTFRTLWCWIAHPQVRLPANFPLSLAQVGREYAFSLVLYLAGSLAPAGVFYVVLWYFSRTRTHETMEFLANPFNVQWLVIGVAVVSCVVGLGLQIWWLRRSFHQRGIRMRDAIALNLNSLRQAKGGPIWAVCWRALLTLLLILAIEIPYSLHFQPDPGPAAMIGKMLSGWSFGLFALLAVVLAPLLEELICRGFLLNTLRVTFRSTWLSTVLPGDGLADFGAILVSSAIFAGMHMLLPEYMSLPLFVVLLMKGMFLGELYRRSGTLWAPITCHALNNTLATILLALS